MRRFWPQTLSGRIALILIVGMMASQLVTGTVWFDARYGRVAEVPVRIGAARAADIIRMLDVLPPPAQDALSRQLSDADTHIAFTDASSSVPDAPPGFSDRLLDEVIRSKLGERADIRLHTVALRGDDGDPMDTVSLLTARLPTAEIGVDAKLADGRWVNVTVRAGQEGMDLRPGAAFVDVFLRIYLIRVLAVVGIAFLAVRIAVRPLAALSSAAERLGHNLNAPPLQLDGPREVRRAAQTFNLMQQRLQESIAERSRFLAAVSHDLRSPITRLRLRAESVQPESLRARFRGDLEEMESMIASTLDFVKGTDVNEVRQKVDLDSLVQAVATDMEEMGGDVRVLGSCSCNVWGYPRSLRRCLQNLLENAMRYGGNRATVTFDVSDRTGIAMLDIAIVDAGPGIPDDALERVFEPYFRIEPSRNRSTGGVGLGLAIARTIAQGHAGEIFLMNLPEGGLRASLRLPICDYGGRPLQQRLTFHSLP